MSFTGRIYKIVAIDPEFKEEHTYYGSTTKPVKSRYSSHICNYNKGKGTSAKQVFDTYGVKNCYIYQLEEINCDTIDDLRKKEAEYIINNPCVNKKIPYICPDDRKRLSAEYFREYYMNHPEYRLKKLTRMREYSKKRRQEVLNN